MGGRVGGGVGARWRGGVMACVELVCVCRFGVCVTFLDNDQDSELSNPKP